MAALLQAIEAVFVNGRMRLSALYKGWLLQAILFFIVIA